MLPAILEGERMVQTMGKDLKGRELGAGISQRKSDKRFTARYKGKTRYADSLKEARTAYRILVEEVDTGTFIEKDTITLQAYFEQWLEGLYTVKQSTVLAYHTAFKRIPETIRGKKLQQISKTEIHGLFAALQKKCSTQSTKLVLVVLNQICKAARRDGIIKINPCEDITVKGKKNETKAIDTNHRAMTKEEQVAFMEAAKDNWFYNMLAFMLQTGVRTGEARGLQWRDIDYKREVIHIVHNASQDKDGKDIITTPKTRTSVRDIPLTENLKQILQRQRIQCRDMFGNIQKLDGFVFVTPKNKLIDKYGLRWVFKQILRKMDKNGQKMEYISPHALRDTFATRAIEAGMNPQTLKTILGHASLSMTMDLYAHVLPDTKREEMEKIAGAF